MLTSLQALLRLASLRWLGVFIFALATLLATTSSASALEPAQTKTRVWGFDFAEHNSFGLFRAASSGKHQENQLAGAEAASGSLLAARGAGLAERAAQVHGALDPIAQAQRTTAALDTGLGRIIAGGARDLTPAQRALLGSGEIAAKLPGAHAEVTALNAARGLGATPEAMAVTRAICPACAAAIEASGGTITSPTTVIWK